MQGLEHTPESPEEPVLKADFSRRPGGSGPA